MPKQKKGVANKKKAVLNPKITKTDAFKKQIRSPKKKVKIIPLSARRVRHYQPELVDTIKHSLNTMHPAITDAHVELKTSNDYIHAIATIEKNLAMLAETLTDIILDGSDTLDNHHYHDLLANLFNMPGTENNGIHLVAETNMAALTDDLQLEKNSKVYEWIMHNGTQLLESCILSRINNEMTALEENTSKSYILQHERAIELQVIDSHQSSDTL